MHSLRNFPVKTTNLVIIIISNKTYFNKMRTIKKTILLFSFGFMAIISHAQNCRTNLEKGNPTNNTSKEIVKDYEKCLNEIAKLYAGNLDSLSGINSDLEQINKLLSDKTKDSINTHKKIIEIERQIKEQQNAENNSDEKELSTYEKKLDSLRSEIKTLNNKKSVLIDRKEKLEDSIKKDKVILVNSYDKIIKYWEAENMDETAKNYKADKANLIK